MKRLPCLISRIAVTLVFALPFPVQAAENATDLLSQATEAPIHTSYIAQIENIRFGTRGTRAIILRVEHLAPNLTRRAYLAPEALFGNSVVIDSNHVYEFDVRHRRVISSLRKHSNGPAEIHNLALLKQNYRAVMGPSSTIAGVRAQSIALLNRHTGEKAMTLWFDEKTHLIVGKEAYHKDGAVSYQMRFETLRYTADIPRNVFSIAVPSGYTRIARDQREAAAQKAASDTDDFRPHELRSLPDGFRLVSVTHPRINTVRMAHLLYSDGVRSVSVFENEKDAVASLHGYTPDVVQIGHQQGRIISSGPNSLLTWRGNDKITYTLVGDLSEQELMKIADSLK